MPNFNPFFNILHDYVPFVAKSAREDLLVLDTQGIQVEGVSLTKPGLCIYYSECLVSGNNEQVIKIASEVANKIKTENKDIIHLFSTLKSFVELIQKDTFTEAEIETLESKAEE